jgi:hypothetical protein
MIIPEEVQAQWRIKVEELSTRPELVLPFPSNVALTISGALTDPESVGALSLLMSIHPHELPLELGAAKCKPLDRHFFDTWRREAGPGRPPRGHRALESVLIATDEAVHYIAPNVRQHRRWQWDAVQLIRGKDGRYFSKIVLIVLQESYEVTLGPSALANLLAVQAWRRGST